MKEMTMIRRMMKGLIAALCVIGIAGAAYADDQAEGSGNQAKKAEIFAQLGHTAFVHAVAFSPDGRTIVSGSWDKTLKL